MTSSTNPKDYRNLRNPAEWGLSEANTLHLRRFIDRKRAAGASLSTINTYVEKIRVWIGLLGLDDVRDATADDILAAYLSRLDRVNAGEYSAATLEGDVIALKQFAQVLHGKEAVKDIVPIARKRPKNRRTSDEYVSVSQVKQMRDYAASTGDIRGVALLMLTYGTGARISEILDAKVRDLKIKQYNAVLSVDGKTGRRDIPFVIGMPELISWLSSHPVKGNDGKVSPDAPLFVTYNTRGHGTRPLSRKRAESYFAKVAHEIGIPDDVKSSPHAFRHRLATIMARKLTIREMNLFFGWSDDSTTALTYIHTSQEELEGSVLEINGVTTSEEAEKGEAFVIQCPSCGKILPSGSQWCTQCRLILDPVLAVQMDSIISDMARKDVMETYLHTRD